MLRLLPVSVIVPVRSAFVVNMPYDGRISRDFKPLGDLITIHQLKDEIAVMASLQSPKKIIFIGRYALILSPGILVPCCPHVFCGSASMPVFIEFHCHETKENVACMGSAHPIKVQNVTLFHYTAM